ncbi:MAG: DUF4364 family protein [Eubacteriales bacterium]|nr:DUF4364 family protein [Eubacteriales bacterium]
MANESQTLYKLMVLYMLDQVSFPLTSSQLSEFFIGKDYTSWFILQDVLHSLEESGFTISKQVNNSTHYEITDDGCTTLKFFSDEILPAIKDDMDEFLKTNKLKMRSETSVTADYYRPDNGDYIVRLRIKEGREDLLSIDIPLPDEGAAKKMVSNWKNKSQSIYQTIMQSLL